MVKSLPPPWPPPVPLLQSVGLVGVAAVDSFCDLVPPRELDPRRDGAFGLYRRDGERHGVVGGGRKGGRGIIFMLD